MASLSGATKMASSSTTTAPQEQTRKPLKLVPRLQMAASPSAPTGPPSSHPSSQDTAQASPAAVVNLPPQQRAQAPLPLKDEILTFEPQKQILYLDAGVIAYMADLFRELRAH